MNRDQIWQQLKDEKETVYGRKMLEMFLLVTEKLNIDHIEEALDSGYEINENFLIGTIYSKVGVQESHSVDPSYSVLQLLTVMLKKKDMSRELMRAILSASFSYYWRGVQYGGGLSEIEMKEIAKKMNLNKMTLDDIYILALTALDRPTVANVNLIEKIYEIFGDRMRNFDTKQVLNLLERSISYNIDKVVNILGGWKSVVEKMKEGVKPKPTSDYDFRGWQLVPLNDFHELRTKLRELRKYFAEKIIENDKSADAMKLAKFFYPERIEPNVGKA